MHNAPSVSYPAGRSAAYGGLLAAAWLAGAAAMGLWWASGDGLSWRQLLGLCTLLPAAGLALWSWQTGPQGELRWTGQGWLWSGARTREVPAVEGLVSVHLDWQWGLLLRFQPLQPLAREPALWLWLGHSSHPARWRALRRAVYSPARMQANLTPDATSMDSPVPP